MTLTMPPCKILEWDTSFFGFRVAMVFKNALDQELAENIDTWCLRNSVQCLYFLARGDDSTTTNIAMDHNFRLVDIRMTLRHQMKDIEQNLAGPDAETVRLRSARSNDLIELEDIARDSYHDTRYYFDENFPRELVSELYSTWVRNSFNGYADTVLVVEDKNTPIGYITCDLEEERCQGRIGLVGVHKSQRGKGLGRLLVNHALEWFTKKGADTVVVVTQGRNIAAQRLYHQCGFMPHKVQLWYHKWF